MQTCDWESEESSVTPDIPRGFPGGPQGMVMVEVQKILVRWTSGRELVYQTLEHQSKEMSLEV